MILPEIIAPIGCMEHLEVALQAGADAAYIGLCGFSARPDSASFTPAGAAIVCQRLHIANKRLYLAINAQMFQSHLSALNEVATAIQQIEPDALILSDLALADQLRLVGIKTPFHASNLTGVYNLETVRYLKNHGFTRIILVSNLFLDEITDLTRMFPEMEYEIISLGGLCANDCRRCRLPHQEHNGHMETGCQKLYFRLLNNSKMLSQPDQQPKRWLGVGDMDLSGNLSLYLALGFRGFKIEGRTRETAYVESAIRKLRNSLDAALVFQQPENALPYLAPGHERGGSYA